jgi:uncharacterized protein YjbI with pentapeptide repeats
LQGARLISFSRREAVSLRAANLRDAELKQALLSRADLSDADLSDANLWRADLSGADLRSAVGITTEELERRTSSLDGATMPDGSKHS